MAPFRLISPTTIGAMPTKNGGALMGKPMDQVKAFAASNALHYVRQLISIVGRYGTLDTHYVESRHRIARKYLRAPRCFGRGRENFSVVLSPIRTSARSASLS